MAEPLNRAEIVALLERLGGDDDAEVLESARALHAIIKAAGVGWDELLVAEDSGGTNVEMADEPATDETTANVGGDDGAMALVEKLLARPGITEDFRQELEGYKSDIAEGAFGPDDHRYLVAVSKRLSGKH